MLEYKNWTNNHIRVYAGQAWAEFDYSGELLNQSKIIPGFVSETFPADLLAEAAETIKSLKPAPYASAYLRFNDLPAGGKSVNHATGREEKGISCYPLTWDLVSQSYKRTGGALDGAMIAYAIQGAPMYFIAGEECGTGSDGEPVIKNAKILSRAKYDREREGYITL